MTDAPNVSKRPKIKEPPEAAELRAAFEKWAEEHGMIWFDNDSRLAEAIAKVLNIDLVWGEALPEAGMIPTSSRDKGQRPKPPIVEVWRCAECGSEDGPHFDRSLCACGVMHDYCGECGLQVDPCDPTPTS